MKTEHNAYIALGSNQNDPMAQTRQAMSSLRANNRIRVRACSSWYQNKAISHIKQANYVNGVALIATNLDPFDLLKFMLSIEVAQGRSRAPNEEKNGPRNLDLDLLLYDDLTINQPKLTVPHPRMVYRDFVLIPLLEIAPKARLPNGEYLSLYLENARKYRKQFNQYTQATDEQESLARYA